MESLSTWSSGSPFLRTNQRGNRNTIFWIDVSLIIIFNHKNNSSFCTLPCCLQLAYFSLILYYPWIELVIPKVFLSMKLRTPSVSFSSLSIIFLSSEVQVKLSSVSSYAHMTLLHLMSFLKSFDPLASIFTFCFCAYFVEVVCVK